MLVVLAPVHVVQGVAHPVVLVELRGSGIGVMLVEVLGDTRSKARVGAVAQIWESSGVLGADLSVEVVARHCSCGG